MNSTPAAQNTALAALRDTVALWYVDQNTAADIVFAACDLLASGVDGTALRELAASGTREGDRAIDGVLEPALDELGLPCHQKGSPGARHEALVAMASLMLSGAVTPRALATAVM